MQRANRCKGQSPGQRVRVTFLISLGVKEEEEENGRNGCVNRINDNDTLTNDFYVLEKF